MAKYKLNHTKAEIDAILNKVDTFPDLNNYAGTTAPSVSDDTTSGYSVGSLWINTTASPKEAYRCVDATEGAAVWLNTTVEIGDLGSMAIQDANNVNITGGSMAPAVVTQDASNRFVTDAEKATWSAKQDALTNPIDDKASPGEIGGATPAPVNGTTGTFSGELSGTLKEITKSSTATLTAAECKGTVINNLGQTAETTLTLPTCEAGLNFLLQVSTSGAGAVHIKAGASDKHYFDGVTLDDGDKVSISTPAVGDCFAMTAIQTGESSWDWMTSTVSGYAIDGGA
jgi:hypothetical protein